MKKLFSFEVKRVIKNADDIRYKRMNEIIDFFYDIVIVNRNKYLTDFYYAYFESPNPYSLQWDNLTGKKDIFIKGNDNINKLITEINNHTFKKYDQTLFEEAFEKMFDQNIYNINIISMQKNDGSRRIIRNLNYLGLLHTTKITNSMKSNISFWQTFIDMYNNLLLQDRLFTPACLETCLNAEQRAKSTINMKVNTLFYHIQQYQPKASILNPYTIRNVLFP